VLRKGVKVLISYYVEDYHNLSLARLTLSITVSVLSWFIKNCHSLGLFLSPLSLAWPSDSVALCGVTQ